MNNKMIVVDGVDGSGKGVQTRRLHQALVEAGHQENLYDPRRMITSGPGFKRIKQ